MVTRVSHRNTQHYATNQVGVGKFWSDDPPLGKIAPITALCLALSTPGTVGVVHDVAMFGSTPVVSSGCMPVATANFFS